MYYGIKLHVNGKNIGSFNYDSTLPINSFLPEMKKIIENNFKSKLKYFNSLNRKDVKSLKREVYYLSLLPKASIPTLIICRLLTYYFNTQISSNISISLNDFQTKIDIDLSEILGKKPTYC